MAKKKLCVAAVLLICFVMLLSGCGEGVIFVEKGSVTDDMKVATERTMVANVFYVKDGTSFYPLTATRTEQKNDVPDPEKDFLMTRESLDALPTLYKGETLCIKQGTSSGLSELPVVRYKDAGSTVGIYGLKYDETMDYYTTLTSSVSNGSQAAATIASLVYGSNFAVRTVDGNAPVLSKAGTLMGLELGKDYVLDIYAGTDYAPVTMTADSHLYESSEGFALKEGSLTKLGYYAYKMPDGCRSGYYRVSSYLFRYIEDTKAQAAKTYDMNLANTFEGVTYTLDDTLPEETREQTFVVEENSIIRVSLAYTAQQAILSEVYITSPSEKKTELDIEGRTAQEYSAKDAGTYTLTLKGYNVYSVDAKITKSKGRPTPTPTPTPTPVPTQPPAEEPPEESGEARLETYVIDESTYTKIDEEGNEVTVNVITQVEEQYDH